MLHEFEEAEKMLIKLIEAASAWRDAWTDILRKEWSTAEEFDLLYQPIVGTSKDYEGGTVLAETPADQMQKASDLQMEYAQLKTDMQEEVNTMDTKLIQKAAEAKEHLQPLKKTIKKRQDKKLDFERYQRSVDSDRKKSVRSEKENASLAKHEDRLAQVTDEYRAADDHLKATLPPVITSTFSLLPHLLAIQIMIQNTLLAQLYTTLHNYSLEHNFQSPPPSMQDVISTWQNDFGPVQQELETSIQSIRLGRAIRQPMGQGKETRSSSLAVRNTPRTASIDRSPRLSPRPSLSSTISDDPPDPQSTPPALDPTSKPRISPSPGLGPQYVMPHRLPSNTASSLAPPNGHLSSSGSGSGAGLGIHRGASSLAASYASPASATYASPPTDPDRFAPAAPTADYFSRDRSPVPSSQPHALSQARSASASSLASSAASLVAQKKKKPPPPPPPPPKRAPSMSNWATALYDFDGQGEGDLIFREGDRIRIVEKTGSVDDWWEGELRGKQGPFPANYVRVG
ncbi:MAG: hypothetical protein Q9165_000449 [Trypethelium subeluteriae]